MGHEWRTSIIREKIKLTHDMNTENDRKGTKDLMFPYIFSFYHSLTRKYEAI